MKHLLYMNRNYKLVFIIGVISALLIGFFVGRYSLILKDWYETMALEEKHDPFEDTDYYDSIRVELNQKVCKQIVEQYTKGKDEVVVCRDSFIIVRETIPSSLILSLPPEEACEKYFSGFGSCHLYWETKKQVFQDEYGISWSSPDELNPDIDYD